MGESILILLSDKVKYDFGKCVENLANPELGGAKVSHSFCD